MRNAVIKRKTGETDIVLELEIDGRGRYSGETGIGFFDHMIALFARHGLFDLRVSCLGDLDVDAHHSVEDIGITLGRAFSDALSDKASIQRYGYCRLPMDEALVDVAIDISGRPYVVFNVGFGSQSVGGLECELFEEFFRAFAFNAGVTLHINLIYGKNSHHIIEAVFKAFARALKQGCKIDKNIEGVMSTKGMI